jgi:prephenate dehydratase
MHFDKIIYIIGEHYLSIHQNLMALKGQKIEDILDTFTSDGIITMYGFLEKISTYKVS